MNRDDLIDLLNKKSIRFKLTEHKPLFTVEDSKNLRGQIDGAHSKNLFLKDKNCLLYTSPSPRDATLSRMPSSA